MRQHLELPLLEDFRDRLPGAFLHRYRVSEIMWRQAPPHSQSVSPASHTPRWLIIEDP